LYRLLDGLDRDRPNAEHRWEGPLGKPIEYRWKQPVQIGGVRIVFDSNLNNNKRQPCSYPQKGDRSLVPETLVKAFRIEIADEHGRWKTVCEESNNYQRLVRVPVNKQAVAIRLTPTATWGATNARLFGFEPIEQFETKIPSIPDGPHFSALVAAIPPRDLAAPDSGFEEPEEKKKRGFSA
jgi:hypothetical protein